jgi:uncharacterized membrane protein (UPF0127 family)
MKHAVFPSATLAFASCLLATTAMAEPTTLTQPPFLSIPEKEAPAATIEAPKEAIAEKPPKSAPEERKPISQNIYETPTMKQSSSIAAVPATNSTPAKIEASIPTPTPTPNTETPSAPAATRTDDTSNAAKAPLAYAPVTYAKERLVLLPKNPPDTTLKGGALFQVDVQSAGSAINPDWFQLAGFKPNQGLLLTYATPQKVDIEPSNIMAAYDIIAVNNFGEIVMILPDLVLANLTRIITTPEDVNAVLYVNAGTASALGLQVSDRLEHRMFQTRPTVIDEAGQSAPVSGGNVDTPEAINGGAATSAVPMEPSIPIDENTRRRPIGNPVIPKPSAPIAPEVTKPTAPAVSAQNTEDPAGTTPPTAPNSNLNAQAIPPVKNQETPEQKNLLDMLLKRHGEDQNSAK